MFTPEQLERLFSLHEVRRIAGHTLDDSHCELIKNTASLESIDFSGSLVTDSGVAQLAERRRWKDLDFTDTQVTLQGIDRLARNGTRVATLRMDSIEDTEAFIGVIRQFKGLSTLGYPYSKLPKADAITILSWCSQHPKELYDTAQNSGLLSTELIPWMLGKSKYTTDDNQVHLNGALIDAAKLSEFTPSLNLQYVTVNNVACGSTQLFAKLCECKGLVELKLYDVPLDRDLILRLKELNRLRHLSLIRCGITDEHLPTLNELSQLHELTLDSNQINGSGLQDFTLARQLDLLSLQSNPLSSTAFKVLQEYAQRFPSLRIEFSE
ncbi:MAG: hypothetical protein SFV81_10015 [Pirellulaceae bacterium]|nr:hypothetical protein [Pirellulaceae bacterium]